eukprot:3171296-Rhodomonas_salina.5
MQTHPLKNGFEVKWLDHPLARFELDSIHDQLENQSQVGEDQGPGREQDDSEGGFRAFKLCVWPLPSQWPMPGTAYQHTGL